MRALAIAATGMSAQEQNLEVIANNVANINTTGFKRSRAEFTDLIYQTERLMGVSNRGRDATIPEGAQIGLGVRTAAIRSVNLQGALTNTGNQLDLAVNFGLTYAPHSVVAARLGLTTLLRRKGRVLDAAAASMATIRSKLSPADKKLLDDLASARAQLAKLTVAGPTATGPDDYATSISSFWI